MKDKHEYYLGVAMAVTKNRKCLKRNYGAIIVKNDEIIATGYNGAPRGRENCTDRGHCPRLTVAHNTDYSSCRSVHAEMNCIISASRNEMIGSTMYLAGTVYGTDIVIKDIDCCPMCKKLIINAGIERVVALDGDDIKIMNVYEWEI